MKRFSSSAGEDVENAKVDAFLREIAAVCERHELSLGHEDRHGAFKVHTYKKANIDWLMEAYDATGDTNA